jgi:phage shock protein PspC (stress-responsive transcriptional regulator)
MPIQLFKTVIEKTAYGVCTKIGDKIGIGTKRIRLFFIYTSFLTLGSPIIIYMILAFWMNMRNYVKEKRNAVWDL